MHVVVAGAGPAGCAAAIVLARAGLDVLLADARIAAAPRLRVGETLPGVATAALRDLRIAPDRLEACGARRSTGTEAAWGSGEPVWADAILDPHGHGWHLDRGRFDAMLLDQARAAGAQVCADRVGVAAGPPADVRAGADADIDVAAAATPCGPILRIGGDPVNACRLIDATGRPAAAARRLGAKRMRTDRLIALYAPVRTPRADVDARTRIEATACGWWYSALVAPRRRVTAFLTDADLVDPALRTEAGFEAALATTRRILPAGGPFELFSPPASTAAHGARLRPCQGNGWLAAGDAALAFDPLSSQGILNALITGMFAATTIMDELAGAAHARANYEARLAHIWAAYEVNRANAYALERRWPDEAFWIRRRHRIGPETPA